jgi:hypothetical protein
MVEQSGNVLLGLGVISATPTRIVEPLLHIDQNQRSVAVQVHR